MTTRILYSQATQTGKSLAQAVNDVLTARASMGRVKKLLDAASSGNDWAAVAAEVGLPANQAGADQAQALWTIASTAQGVLDGGQIAELARLDQG